MNLDDLRTRLLATPIAFAGSGRSRCACRSVRCSSARAGGSSTTSSQVTKYFGELGIPFPAFNATLASTTELVGGTLLFLGLLTRLATVPLSIVMLVAIITARRPDIDGLLTFLAFIEVTYLSGFLWLLLAGAGKISLDALLFGRRVRGCPRSRCSGVAPPRAGAGAPARRAGVRLRYDGR